MIVDIQNVSKSYGRFLALDNVSCRIERGEIVGFLGQNGAGKTTLMRILSGYLPATSGKVLIDGLDVERDSVAVRRKIGYLPEVPPLYPQMSVREFLVFSARMKDIPPQEIRAKVDKALSDCDLNSIQARTISHLSLGYKQRVGIAQAILNDPALLILDEPTKGLDPIQVRHIRQLIVDLKEKRTVILSTHILSEIEQVAPRVLMINQGRIIADSALETLYATHGGSLEDIFFKLNTPAEEQK